MAWFYEVYGGGVFLKPLPNATRPKLLGYLAYSSNFSDVEATQNLITSELKKKGIKGSIGVKLQKLQKFHISPRECKERWDIIMNVSVKVYFIHIMY